MFCTGSLVTHALNSKRSTACGTADCKSCNKQAEHWKTTNDLLCLNREEGPAEARKIIRFIHGKSIVVFHCFACVLQDFCNLLYLDMAVASGPAGPVLAGPVLTVTFGTAHAQIMKFSHLCSCTEQ